MLDAFLDMLKQAEMISGYEIEDDKCTYDGEEFDCKVVKIPVDIHGSCIEAIFHAGTETLFDMNINKVCTCGHHQ